MTIGVVLSVGHHREGYGAGGPTPELPDGRRLLFDQDLFGRWGGCCCFNWRSFSCRFFSRFAMTLGLR